MSKLIPFILLLSIQSCGDSACCEKPPPSFPEFIVINANETDLLNPKNPGNYPHSEILLSTFREGKEKTLSIEINEPDSIIGSTYYSIISIDREIGYLERESYREFILKLDSTSIDTISLTLTDGWITKYELNHEDWSQGKRSYFVIVK